MQWAVICQQWAKLRLSESVCSSLQWFVCCLVAKSCLTLRSHGLWSTRLLCPWEEYWSRLPCPSPRRTYIVSYCIICFKQRISFLGDFCYRLKTLLQNSTLNGLPYLEVPGLPRGSAIKNPPANAGDIRGLIPGSGKIPWRRAWQPTPVFLSGESHGQRSLAGYSPWGRRVRHD